MNIPNSLRAGALALGLACLSAPAARAVMITVNSVQYDITTVAGNYASLQTTLQSQPWFGDATKAVSFADAVGNQLGIPNSFSLVLGPWFAWGTELTFVRFVAFDPAAGFASGFFANNGLSPEFPQRTWAVATLVTSVPDAGATIAMLGAALAGLMVLRRRLAPIC